VALQSINLMTEHNVQASLAELTEKDILIKPALGEFSSGDFTKAMETIPIGIAAARAVQDKLERLSVSEADYKAWQLSRAERKPGEVMVADIQVGKNMKWVNPVVIESEIEKKPGLVEYLVTKQPDEQGLKKLEQLHNALPCRRGELARSKEERVPGQDGISFSKKTYHNGRRRCDCIGGGIHLSRQPVKPDPRATAGASPGREF
jgi:hypothetical protein